MNTFDLSDSATWLVLSIMWPPTQIACILAQKATNTKVCILALMGKVGNEEGLNLPNIFETS